MKAEQISERMLDEALAAAVFGSPTIAEWLLSFTKFKGRRASLDVEEPWQFRWYRSPLTTKDSETDIFLRFSDTDGSDSAFALHIENKLGNGSFRLLQPEDYRHRGEDQRERWRYQDFATVLIAPVRFRLANRANCAKFDAFISHEQIADYVPLFRSSQ